MKRSAQTEQPGLDEFRPTEGGGESADPGVLAVAAYIVFWLLISAFIATSWRRQRAIERRLERLERTPQGETSGPEGD